jgi:hypothetical protein
MLFRTLLGLGLALWSVAAPPDFTAETRMSAIRRAQVWMPVDVAAYDFQAAGGDFAPWATVACSWVDKRYGGNTPKFACALTPGDEAKIKYGDGNSEVYAGVAATRLMRALGFGVDALYPVRVECRGCPSSLGGTPGGPEISVFGIAALERKWKGNDIKVDGKEGWAWSELDLVDPAAGGAPRAQRDALKLMAVFLQHSDNKTVQQRLLCRPAAAPATTSDTAAPDTPAPPAAAPGPCGQPFMMIHDLGHAFGKANKFNRPGISGVHLANWSETPVWKDAKQCVGNLSKSFTGNLSNPRISEEGRKFLADLLLQLTDAQLHDLFTVARFADGPLRMRAPGGTPEATVAAWVDAFKRKRDDIVRAHCP